jgi:hypothetical protein
MLKALVQLFAEKFLQSKYPDIAYQCGPGTTVQNQNVQGGGQQDFIAPFSGWAVFQIGGANDVANKWFRLENSTRKVSYLTNATSGWKWASIPIQKGDTIVVDLGVYSGSGNLTFVRNESSK